MSQAATRTYALTGADQVGKTQLVITRQAAVPVTMLSTALRRHQWMAMVAATPLTSGMPWVGVVTLEAVGSEDSDGAERHPSADVSKEGRLLHGVFHAERESSQRDSYRDGHGERGAERGHGEQQHRPRGDEPGQNGTAGGQRESRGVGVGAEGVHREHDEQGGEYEPEALDAAEQRGADEAPGQPTRCSAKDSP